MKVFIQEFVKNQFNAGSKARNDCDSVLCSLGYKPYLLYLSNSFITRQFLRIYNLFLMPFKLRKVDSCFLQYPYYSYQRMSKIFYKWLLWNCKGKEVDCLIHDINNFRERKEIEPELVYLLKQCAKIVVHTVAMKELLIRTLDISPDKIRVLYLFDYLTQSSIQFINPAGREVIFAGNLNKSKFLTQLGKVANSSLTFSLYGVYSSNIVETAYCVYKGVFQPDDVSAMRGDWGLVWDGDSLDTCSGSYGEYLKLNSSHKISLYLSAGKPVIIWEESSLHDFIVRNHLGISIRSLFEIESKLESLTIEDMEDIKISVLKFSDRLRSGYFLKHCIN